MKLEIGMYVRIQNDVENLVIINRIANIFENTILTENDGSIYQGEYTKDNIIKSSYNIIDLIEVGDIVDKKEVINVYRFDDGFNRIELFGGKAIMNNTPIKSIITKEQIENIEYRIGEEK